MKLPPSSRRSTATASSALHSTACPWRRPQHLQSSKTLPATGAPLSPKNQLRWQPHFSPATLDPAVEPRTSLFSPSIPRHSEFKYTSQRRRRRHPPRRSLQRQQSIVASSVVPKLHDDSPLSSQRLPTAAAANLAPSGVPDLTAADRLPSGVPELHGSKTSSPGNRPSSSDVLNSLGSLHPRRSPHSAPSLHSGEPTIDPNDDGHGGALIARQIRSPRDGSSSLEMARRHGSPHLQAATSRRPRELSLQTSSSLEFSLSRSQAISPRLYLAAKKGWDINIVRKIVLSP
ncbi:hypothetical protein MLD38_011169 [Melastoma candidum]|uniref:Uncharacterized protein n=1 Tax=Melastoma candidum TaxID=119954 RepID=A0ACB9R5P0_9MYRT|nr:hypothetical protein MLD38_011169 [Melastoma candidum]